MFVCHQLSLREVWFSYIISAPPCLNTHNKRCCCPPTWLNSGPRPGTLELTAHKVHRDLACRGAACDLGLRSMSLPYTTQLPNESKHFLQIRVPFQSLQVFLLLSLPRSFTWRQPEELKLDSNLIIQHGPISWDSSIYHINRKGRSKLGSHPAGVFLSHVALSYKSNYCQLKVLTALELWLSNLKGPQCTFP